MFPRRAFLLLFTRILLLAIPCVSAVAGTGAASGPVVPAKPEAGRVVEIWPEGKVPPPVTALAEAEVARNDGFRRITNVSRPTLTLFPAAPRDGRPAPAVIVCPGGGYSYVVVDKEGSEIAAWLNQNGFSALVLKYRTPNNRSGALQDLQRALSLTRARAAEWGVDPARLGVIGFSAGGHLAARAGCQADNRGYPACDAADRESCRPDFSLLIYPAYLDDKAGHCAPDVQPLSTQPPTFIAHSEDDKSFVTGSKLYQAALTAAKVPHEFKLYPTGGHGYGLHCDRDAKSWPDEALTWLKKIVPAPAK